MTRTRPVTERVRHSDERSAKRQSTRRQTRLRTVRTFAIDEEMMCFSEVMISLPDIAEWLGYHLYSCGADQTLC